MKKNILALGVIGASIFGLGVSVGIMMSKHVQGGRR